HPKTTGPRNPRTARHGSGGSCRLLLCESLRERVQTVDVHVPAMPDLECFNQALLRQFKCFRAADVAFLSLANQTAIGAGCRVVHGVASVRSSAPVGMDGLESGDTY